MRPHVKEIRDGGGELVVVGSGAPHFARAFREDMEIADVPVFSDEKLRSYQLAGFQRTVGGVIHPAAAWAWVRSMARGHLQRGQQGDPLQNGGVMVVTRGGEVVYKYASRHGGDHPAATEIIAAVRGVR